MGGVAVSLWQLQPRKRKVSLNISVGYDRLVYADICSIVDTTISILLPLVSQSSTVIFISFKEKKYIYV
jgi:hypothetical protein